MYKEMIPADIAARMQPCRATYGTNGLSASQRLPRSTEESAALRMELTEWKERCLRLAADFDNYRKRVARESEQQARELRNTFVGKLLPVVDNLERALRHGSTHSTEQLREEVQLTLRQLVQALEEQGFTGRDDLGQPFDPRYHEAICVRREPMQPDKVILEVWQRGWLQGKALFRPAKVVVNDLKGSTQADDEPNIQREKGADHG